MTAELENHCVCAVLICFGRVSLFVAPRTTAHRAPLSMGFSRQEYWSGLPCPPPGDLPGPGTEPTSPVSSALQADSLPLSPQGSPVRIITQKSASPESIFSHHVSSPQSFLLGLIPSPLFPLSYFRPSSHHPPYLSQSLISLFSTSTFPVPLSGEGGRAGMGSGQCFSNCWS